MTALSQKPRIGIFIYTPMIGGAELYCRDLLRHLSRDQFDVTLFCEPWAEFVSFLDLAHGPQTDVCFVRMREVGGHYGARELTDATAPKQLRWSERVRLRLIAVQKRLASPFLKAPGRLARAVMQVGDLAVNMVRLSTAFREHPVDILHVINGGYPGAQSARIAAWITKRVGGCSAAVMSVCNTPVARYFPRTYERFLDRLVRRSFDALITPGDYIGKLLVDLRGFPSAQLERIPEGVASPEQYGSVRTTSPAPVPTSTPTIIMVAGFLPHKGHRFLLEALSHLRPEFPNVHATLIGDGPLSGEVRELANRIGLAGAVTFPGFLPLTEMLAAVLAADLFVHPALMEGMPYVILHAMSVGKPVIATPIGGIPEVVEHGVTGILVPPGDSGALADAIRELLTNPARTRSMGDAGRRRYEREHTVGVMVERHAALYAELARSRLTASETVR